MLRRLSKKSSTWRTGNVEETKSSTKWSSPPNRQCLHWLYSRPFARSDHFHQIYSHGEISHCLVGSVPRVICMSKCRTKDCAKVSFLIFAPSSAFQRFISAEKYPCVIKDVLPKRRYLFLKIFYIFGFISKSPDWSDIQQKGFIVQTPQFISNSRMPQIRQKLRLQKRCKCG